MNREKVKLIMVVAYFILLALAMFTIVYFKLKILFNF